MPDAPARAASLVVLGGPCDGRRLVLDQAIDEALIGSDPSCGLCLDLAGVSPLHARIFKDASGVTVHDTRSPRGVYVNDDRVADRASVREGDIVWLGLPGDAQSVMLQCRWVQAGESMAPPSTEPSPAVDASASDDEVFFVDEAAAPPPERAVPTDDFAVDPDAEAPFFPEETDETFLVEGAVPRAEPTRSQPEAVTVIQADDEDVFVVDETLPPPAPDEQFFVDEGLEDTVRPDPAPSPPPPLAAGTVTVADLLASPTAAPVRLSTPTAASPIASGAASVPAIPSAAPAPPAPAAAPAVMAPAPAPGSRGDREQRRTERAPSSRRAPSSPAGPAVRGERAAAPAPRPAAATGRPMGRYAAVAAAILVVIAAAFFGLRAFRGPRLRSAAPPRVGSGQSVTLAGEGFSTVQQENAVLFAGDKPGRVVRASATELVVEIPELDAAPGQDIKVPVVVQVKGRVSAPLEITVHPAPRIHGVSPSVAMPGEEIVLAGSGWGLGATVRFGSKDADVVTAGEKSLRVRVPAIEGPPGTPAPVVVSSAGESSNPAPFLVGRLPLVVGVEPRTAPAGETVTLAGRGFHHEPARNTVRIAGTRALVIASAENELKAVVPWVAPPAGEVRVEVQVPASDHVGESALTVPAPTDPLALRFVAEPFDDAAGHDHVVLSTGLGPAFVLTGSAGRSAADRALEAQRRLNEAAAALRASRDLDFESRGLGSDPSVALRGKPDAVLSPTREDASAYEEDWTKLKGKGGPVTRDRLAVWWAAVARDLVLLLARGEKPHHAAALAAEGRALADVHQAARKGGGFGVPRDVAARPAFRDAMRLMALRVPASVAGPAPVASTTTLAPTTPASPPAAALKLDGAWFGVEIAGGRRTYVTVTFRGNGGTFALESAAAVSVSTPLATVERLPKNAVHFSVQIGGRTRHYLGRWEGVKMVGKVASDAAGREELGTFELTPGR